MRILGHGIYGLSEGASLLGVPATKLRAWFNGWSRRDGRVLTPDYAEDKAISFLDLIDACVIALLRKEGVSLQAIRKIYRTLADLWNTEHPFCREGFQELLVDQAGRRVFLQAADESGDTIFLEILKNQHAMPEVLKPLLTRVKYSPTTRYADRLMLAKGVIIDPRIRFGKPIVESCRMPTALLYAAYQAQGNDIESVADWYNVTPSDVRIAVDFEEGFSGIAA